MKLNKDKTEAMVISSSNKDLSWKPELKVGEEKAKIVSKYKSLGVVVDNGLRFREHVERITERAKKRINIMKCLAGKDWGQSTEALRDIYLTYIRSGLEYASPSWYPWICQTLKDKLEATQNGALRVIAGLYKTTPQDYLNLETGIEPLNARLTKNNMIAWDKYQRNKEEDERRVLLTRDVPPRIKTRAGWRNVTKPMMKEYEVVRESSRKMIPPWQELGINIEQVSMPRKKEEMTREEMFRLTEEKIESLKADVHLYTDGSTSGLQENGGAGVYTLSASSLPAVPQWEGTQRSVIFASVFLISSFISFKMVSSSFQLLALIASNRDLLSVTMRNFRLDCSIS